MDVDDSSCPRCLADTGGYRVAPRLSFTLYHSSLVIARTSVRFSDSTFSTAALLFGVSWLDGSLVFLGARGARSAFAFAVALATHRRNSCGGNGGSRPEPSQRCAAALTRRLPFEAPGGSPGTVAHAGVLYGFLFIGLLGQRCTGFLVAGVRSPGLMVAQRWPTCAAGASRATKEPGAPLRRRARGWGAERQLCEAERRRSLRRRRSQRVARQAGGTQAARWEFMQCGGARRRSGRVLIDERSEEHLV